MFTGWHLISLIFNAQKNCSIFMNESVKRFNIHIEFFFKSKLVFKTKLILMNGSLHN